MSSKQQEKKQAAAKERGEVVQIIGAVVDVEFPPQAIPRIYQALQV